MTAQPDQKPERNTPKFWTRQRTEVGMPVMLPHPYLESGRINANSLKRYRRMHGITQKQLAILLNISDRTVRRAEMGRKYSRRTEEALVYFMLATRDIVEEHGIIPPHKMFRRYFDSGEFDPIWRKEWVHEFLTDLEPRVQRLKLRVKELEREVIEKDQLIRDLAEQKSVKFETMEKQMRKMKADMERLMQQVGVAG